MVQYPGPGRTAQKATELRIISPEPVLAKILASRRPILIGEEGYYWLVNWIATIGSILRSRENMVYTIVGAINTTALNLVFGAAKGGLSTIRKGVIY